MLGLVITLSVSCKDDDVVEPDPKYTTQDFVGSWIAETLVHTSNSDPEKTIDMVEIGGEVRVTVLDHGGSRTWVELGTYSDEWDAQMILIDDNTFRSVPIEEERGVSTFSFEFDGEDLILTNKDDNFDFTLMGEEAESTTAVGRFVRH